MNPSDKHENYDELISSTFGRNELKFDFDTFKQNHPEAVLEYLSKTKDQSNGRHNTVPAWRKIMNSKLTKLTAAAVIIVAIILGMNFLNIQMDGANIAWADVVEHFRAVTSFEATIYLKEDTISEPVQLELWFGSGGKVRVRSGSQVVFGETGNILKAFDIQNRKETKPDPRAVSMIKSIKTKEYSLDTIISILSQGNLKDVTPLVNQDAEISQDIVVFDLESEYIRQWVRIWALRESKLPIRLKMFDPEDGETVDAIFTYSRQQSDKFFDVKAYGEFLAGRDIPRKATIAYHGLIDPDENEVAPNTRDDHKVFQVTTTTLGGKPWSVAEHHKDKHIVLYFWSLNRTHYLSEIESINKLLSGRKDFVFASVVLTSDANAVRRYIKKNSISGLHLQESGKGFTNSLSSALGVNNEGRIAVIEKDGTVKVVSSSYVIKPMIEMLDHGLTYTSYLYLQTRLCSARSRNLKENKSVIEALCGRKGKVTKTDCGEAWEYVLFDQKKENGLRVNIEFDHDGNYLGVSSSRWIVNPASIKFQITQQCWDDYILPQIEPEIRPENDKQLGYCVSIQKAYLPKGQVGGYSVGSGHPWRGVKAGMSYHRSVKPGVYNVYLAVQEKKRYQSKKQILLLKNVKLDINKTKEFTIDKLHE